MSDFEEKLHFPKLETLGIDDIRYLKLFRNLCECQKLLKVTIDGFKSDDDCIAIADKIIG